jgi:ankyrin repeat protein
MRIFTAARSLLTSLVFAASSLAAQDAQSRLWDAAIAGDTTLIAKAIADGASVDSLDTRANRNGRRALNWAALNNRVDALKFLLAKGAKIDGRNVTGFTALAHAAEVGSAEVAKALLAAGADLNVQTVSGHRAIDIARERGNVEVLALLEAAEKAKKP